MKTSPPTFTVLTLLGALLLACPVHGAPVEWWVAPGGRDTNTGSSNSPLASPAAALEKWRAWSGDGSSPLDTPGARPSGRFNGRTEANETNETNDAVRIILRDGIYPLSTSLLFQSPELTLAHTPLRFEAASGEHPILSGGVMIAGWKKSSRRISLPASAKGQVWVANAPKRDGHILEFRQLLVNDQKAVRARNPNGEKLARLVAWDKTNEVAVIPASTLFGIKNPAHLEMVVDQVWEIAVLRVKSIRYQDANALLTFQQPESRIEFQHPWPPVTVNAKYQAPFFLANAIEFLAEPGEWFEDVSAGKIYYWPRTGENMTHARVIAPTLETLVQIDGSPPPSRITVHASQFTSIHFQGITFAHTTWLRPSQQGHVPLQAGMYMLDAKKLSPKGVPYHPGLDNLAWIGRPPAAVSVKNASHIQFENCTFEHLGSAGLDFESGTHDDWVQGCVFHDLSGNGIQLGKFSDTNIETHLPYMPADETEICAHETIANNVITDCANEDWGCVGIGVGYARNISIAHNEVFNLPYTGISVGWGWTKATNALRDNFIFANRIHHVGQRLGDLGGIYTMSVQAGTIVAENSVSDISPSPYVPDPNHWFYLYLDEGSSFITVRDNWCPSEKFLKNANGPGNVWTNNGPQVSEKIKHAAGLEPAYKNLLPSK